MNRRTSRRIAFVLAVAGISLVSPVVLSAAASKWPNSPAASLNSAIHKGESS